MTAHRFVCGMQILVLGRILWEGVGILGIKDVSIEMKECALLASA